MHFTWGVRQAASDTTPRLKPQLDLVLFPGQATFSKLGGRRMFVLKYEKEEHFFWCVLEMWHTSAHVTAC